MSCPIITACIIGIVGKLLCNGVYVVVCMHRVLFTVYDVFSSADVCGRKLRTTTRGTHALLARVTALPASSSHLGQVGVELSPVRRASPNNNVQIDHPLA